MNMQLAVSIMGTENFFGPAEWKKFLGVSFTKAELRSLREIPISKDELMKRRVEYFLFLGLSEYQGELLTVKKWYSLLRSGLRGDAGSVAVSEKCAFATKHTCERRWYLMRKDVIPVSNCKDFQTQKTLVPPDEEMPLAVEELTKDLLYYILNRRPCKEHWARFRDWGRKVRIRKGPWKNKILIHDRGIRVMSPTYWFNIIGGIGHRATGDWGIGSSFKISIG